MTTEEPKDKASTKMIQIREEDYLILASLKTHPLTFADLVHDVLVKAGLAKEE